MNPPTIKYQASLVLFVTSVAVFTTAFSASSVNVALAPIGTDFHLGSVVLNWVATSFVLSTAAFLMLMGRLGDVYGRKLIFILGMALFCVSSIMASFAPSVAFLIVSRILAGVGSAMTFATVTAILVQAFPPDQRGRVLGINVSLVYLGLSIGPFLGGFVTQNFSWRALFLLHSLLSLVVVILVVISLHGEAHEKRTEKIDWAGSALYALGLSILLIGLTGLTTFWGIALFGAGVASLVAFVVFEKRLEFPLLDVRMFTSNRIFALSNLAALVSYSATFAVAFFLSLYLETVRGFAPQAAGLILIAQPVVQALFSPFAGRLSDKIEPRLLASAGMFFTAVGLGLLIFLDPATSIAYIIGAQVLLGFGFGLFSSPNTNAIMGSVEKKHLGTASAVLATMRNVGQMASLAIALVLFSLILGKAPVNAENASGFLLASRDGFIIFTGLCLGAMFASLARGKVIRPDPLT